MTAQQRRDAADLLATLTNALDPAAPFVVDGESYDGQQAKAVLVTKMIRGLAGKADLTELEAAAKIDWYGDAIDSLPAWAVDAAMKRWAQGRCPASIEEKPRYAFPPSPAALRAMADLELDLMRREKREVEKLVLCVTFEEAMDPDFQPPTGLASMALPGLRRM